ncbi:MAG: biogenesis of lysosome-related organelles complex 1 subunit 2 [Chlorobiaceae bacterium]|jgi:Biogenesis of lysosome-related organelles complex-1 subunit 2
MDSMALRDSRLRGAGVVFLAFLLLLSSCSPEKKKSDPQQEHIESMMAILAQVQKNLGRIQQKESVVERLSSGIEGKGSQDVEQIGKDIASSIRFIDSTLVASKNLVRKLEEENRSSSYRLESLDRLVSELRVAINTKDSEVNTLKGHVQKLNKQLSSLMATVDVLDEYIQDQEVQLYTAYYISGTFNELADKGVLVRINPIEKLFGREYRLAADFNVNRFKKIDITETKDLFFDKPLKSLKIITPHTVGSYELVGGKTSSLLLIRDESAFWQKSRCLVIVVE